MRRGKCPCGKIVALLFCQEEAICEECDAKQKIGNMIAYLEGQYKAFSEPATDEIETITDEFMDALETLGIKVKIHRQLKMEL